MKRHVYVVVLDGLRSQDLDEALTPTLLTLLGEGTRLPGQAVPDLLESVLELGFQVVPPDTSYPADAVTSHRLHALIDSADPERVFVRFGDCDPPLGVVRSLAVRTSDEQVGKLVRHLKATGRWERSVLVVVAGGCAAVSAQRHLDADSLLRGKVSVAGRRLRWTGPASDRAVAWKHLQSVVSRIPGPAAVVPLLVAGPVSTVELDATVGRLLGLPTTGTPIT
ncbi:hypothetical protein [Lentzea sp. NPDC051838]|uniref:hypothetical protein n=1 Tax=Lentzea sp. NPDC051838 TaxID=3154849 RepID=UPI003432DB0B